MDLASINFGVVSGDTFGDHVSVSAPSAEYVEAAALGLVPMKIDVKCNTTGDITREHVRSALARKLPEVVVTPGHERQAVLIGGGPSLRDNWKDVHSWAYQGAEIFALNGAARFLNEHGFTADWQVLMDPRSINVGLIGQAGRYLVASQCAPEIFDALKNKDVTVFHMAGSALDLVSGTCIGGNVTVGLCSMCLTYTIGYRTMRLYGYDSSFAKDTPQHAYPQDRSEQELRLLDVKVRDKDGQWQEFTTNFAMAKQAEEFPKVAAMLAEAGAVMSVHGTGLLPTIAHAMMK